MPDPKGEPGKIRKPISISRIRVENLFGFLTYDIPAEGQVVSDIGRLVILYGDNGSGKTTILTLLFCLLSPVRGRGEKTYIARTPFRHFEVEFDDGTKVAATKSEKTLIGPYQVQITEPDSQVHDFALLPDKDGDISASDPSLELLNRLAHLRVPLYFLPDNRKVRTTIGPTGDLVEPPDPRSAFDVFENVVAETADDRLRRIMSGGGNSHHLEISPVIESVVSWFRSHALLGSNAGEETTTSIYLRVVEQIMFLAGSPPPQDENYQGELIGRLSRLRDTMGDFTRFGLVTPFPADKFLTAFTNANDAAKRTIATVIEPYLDGVEARLTALNEIRSIILTYVETVNEFLVGKSVEFFQQAGIQIYGHQRSVLDPNMLSSGEKQLLLLLSNTILARDTGGLFLIDEPELSLNVKWQRILVDALLRCSQGSGIQYILASHSLELITQHRRSAIRLVPVDKM